MSFTHGSWSSKSAMVWSNKRRQQQRHGYGSAREKFGGNKQLIFAIENFQYKNNTHHLLPF